MEYPKLRLKLPIKSTIMQQLLCLNAIELKNTKKASAKYLFILQNKIFRLHNIERKFNNKNTHHEKMDRFLCIFGGTDSCGFLCHWFYN